jgi:hypothetical protein
LPSARTFVSIHQYEHHRFSYRGLSPHKFTPMPGVHKEIKATGISLCCFFQKAGCPGASAGALDHNYQVLVIGKQNQSRRIAHKSDRPHWRRKLGVIGGILSPYQLRCEIAVRRLALRRVGDVQPGFRAHRPARAR